MEFGDKKVRFGLMIIGAINVAVVAGLLNSPILRLLPPGWLPFVFAYLAVYAAIVFRAFAYAMGALRPRTVAGAMPKQRPGLYFYDDVLSLSFQGYVDAWRSLRYGALNQYVAEQNR